MDWQFGPDDHLSRLPDDTLLEILSKLPFVDAVRSSILSRRWKNLWLHIPNVELKQKVGESFRAFLNRGHLILARRSTAPIEKLDFGIMTMDMLLSHPVFVEETHRFVVSALGKKVKEIALDFAMDAPGCSDNKSSCSCALVGYYYKMNDSHFSVPFKLNLLNGCPLRALKIKDYQINVSDYQNYACLETLWLTRVYPSSGTVQKMVQDLTSACTGLKVFGLESYLLPSRTFPLKPLNMTCWQLEHLTFRCCHCFGNIVVNAPKLKYLEFKGEFNERFAFDIVNSPGLVSATLIISRSYESCPTFSGETAAKIIRQFAHVKFLSVTFYDTKDVIMLRNQRSETPVVFSQLKELNIERYVENSRSLEEILCCMRASPLLERLCISLAYETNQLKLVKGCARRDDEPTKMIKGLLHNRIKQIEISGFNGSMFHFELVKILLNHSTALAEITIRGFMAPFYFHSTILSKLKRQIRSNPYRS